jgi:UDP-N-acetylglucosamine--N-acetylmuramyl-(pentapeptide) pyrophosphoryl-undecaprenol N-acetylglucosamine transferase
MKIVFTGGGTGGHVYPGLALADHLSGRIAPDSELFWLGSRGRAEELILQGRLEDPTLRTIPISFVSSAPFPGKSPLKVIPFLLKLTWGVLGALLFLLRHRPQLLVSMGGYASAPAVIAAALLRKMHLSAVKILVHEQNASPGLMNRLASRLADLTALTFPETASQLAGRCTHSGYPVRADLQNLKSKAEACAHYSLDPTRPVLFVFGGSQGARSLNRALYAVLPELMKAGIQVLHAHGAMQNAAWDAQAEHERALLMIQRSEMSSRLCDYIAKPYFHDIPMAYAAADLVLCRGGAGAIFEIFAAGKASVLVPKMGLPGDHQVANARRTAHTGASKVILEDLLIQGDDLVAGVVPEQLQELLIDLLLRDKLPAMQEAAKAQFNPNALQDLGTTALELVAGRLPKPDASPTQSDILECMPLGQLLQRAAKATPEQVDYLRHRAMAALASEDWITVNTGVKMAGRLKALSMLPLLLHIANDTRPPSLLKRLAGEKYRLVGFLRRNLATTFGQIAVPSAEVLRWLDTHLKDPYWEVRVEVLKALVALGKPGLSRLDVNGLLKNGNFEERIAALSWWERFGRKSAFQEEIMPLCECPNSKVRAKVLAVLEACAKRQEISAESLRPALDQISVTSTDFSPVFPLKEGMRKLARSLQSDGDDASGDNAL